MAGGPLQGRGGEGVYNGYQCCYQKIVVSNGEKMALDTMCLAVFRLVLKIIIRRSILVVNVIRLLVKGGVCMPL